VKVLVVGYGSIGKRHVKNLESYKGVQIIVFTKQKIKNRRKTIFYNSFHTCISEKPDVAIISNVTSNHVKTAIKLAKNNIDIFIEKPLSDSLKHIKKLSNIVSKKKLITMIGCNLRFHHAIEKIKEVIDKNQIGKPISCQVENGSYLPLWHPDEDYKKSYASRRELGGGVVLTSIHEIDYLYWIFGKVSEVTAITSKISDLEIKVEDYAAIIAKFKNNFFAEIHLDYYQRPPTRSFEIIGTCGKVTWDLGLNSVRIYKNRTKKWTQKLKLEKHDHNKMYKKELDHFLKCVQNRRETMNPLSQGIETLKIALAVKKSSKQKKTIKI
jgi:predicted dehydrogenase